MLTKRKNLQIKQFPFWNRGTLDRQSFQILLFSHETAKHLTVLQLVAIPCHETHSSNTVLQSRSVQLSTCNQKMLLSNLCRETGYVKWGFSCFSSASSQLPRYTLDMPWLLPSEFLPTTSHCTIPWHTTGYADSVVKWIAYKTMYS